MSWKRGIGNYLKRKALSPIRQFNVEDRAHKYVDRKQAGKIKSPAPLHDHDAMEISKIPPALKEALREKDEPLDTRLQDVYVESSGENPDTTPRYPLPANRTSAFEEEQFGRMHIHSEDVPKGRISMDQLNDLLTKRSRQPEIMNFSVLADMFSLKEKEVTDVCKYFHLIHLIRREVESEFQTSPVGLSAGMAHNLIEAGDEAQKARRRALLEEGIQNMSPEEQDATRKRVLAKLEAEEKATELERKKYQEEEDRP